MLRLLVAVLALFATAPPAAADPLRDRQWNLSLVEADAAHATSTGAGAVVAVVDSGVAAGHPDLAGRLAAGRDVVDGDATPEDGDGHGTHVTGIVGAATGNGTGVASVAPGARLMPVRVLGADGSGTTAGVVAGIDWARSHGADVINLSLGSEVPIVGAIGGDELDGAIRRALAAGIVVVAAAGNNSMPLCEQPAAAAGLLCVGAVDRRRQRSVFSSFGRGLGVMAPGGAGLPQAGENVLSTYPPDG
jgi:serine protease